MRDGKFNLLNKKNSSFTISKGYCFKNRKVKLSPTV